MKGKRNKLIIITSAALIIGLALFFFLKPDDYIFPSDYPLRVSYLDVGQGDCELIQCEDVTVLIDGGESEQFYNVSSYLKAAGVDRIDCYILTHPHSDHMGIAADIINKFQVDTVFITQFSQMNMPTTKTYEDMLRAAKKTDVTITTVKAGDSYTFASLKIDILAPMEETEDYNDMSIVVKATYKSRSFLFCGDISSNVEEQILSSGANVKADVIKIAHHGSNTSSSDAFLEKVSPELAVISCGIENSYGHPHTETLNTLDKHNIKYFRTDKEGTVLIYSDGHGLNY